MTFVYANDIINRIISKSGEVGSSPEEGIGKMSRYRAFIILLLDVLIIFLCNFLTMLPYLLGQDIRLLNLVLHIGLLTV